MITRITAWRPSVLACVMAIVCLGDIHLQSNASRGSMPPRTLTMVALRVGDRIGEHAYLEDRVEWKLPEKRLERFRKGGVIIKEDRRITIAADAVVVAARAARTSLHTHERISSFDVPRSQVTVTEESFPASLTADNVQPATSQLSEAEAAMVGFPITPARPGAVGQRWRTRLMVVTTLGSGSVTFNHVISSFNNGRAEIKIEGRGVITGTEYHLPKLLPGSIHVTGSAWYDPTSGLVTQESYLIHNQLLKPAEGEQIGFDERLTVDSTTRKIVPKR
jgi:hypothetical protein